MRPIRHAGLAGLALLGACGTAGKRGKQPPLEPAVVIFENRSLYEASVYAVSRGGARTRIGTVRPGRTETLTLRGSALPPGGQVAIVARLLAVSRTPSSGAITLQPGERVAVTLPPEAVVLTVLPVVEREK